LLQSFSPLFEMTSAGVVGPGHAREAVELGAM